MAIHVYSQAKECTILVFDVGDSPFWIMRERGLPFMKLNRSQSWRNLPKFKR
jgi:hypothetical protein